MMTTETVYNIATGETTSHDMSPDLIAGRIEQAWHDLRSGRNALLTASDWTQAADSPVDKYAWAEYRQHLRDLPANTTDPTNVVWPTPPA